MDKFSNKSTDRIKWARVQGQVPGGVLEGQRPSILAICDSPGINSYSVAVGMAHCPPNILAGGASIVITIRPYVACPWTPAQVAELDDIFFTSSATQTFAGAADRAAFRERWLGRYLRVDAAHAFLAMNHRDEVIGYLVGAIEDLARAPRFADLASARMFAAYSAIYPAHLHINVATEQRGGGVGAALIAAFAAHAAALGAPGCHAVTSAASRNVRFYSRCGFLEVARSGPGAEGAAPMVFLARAFADRPAAAITV